MDVTAAWYKDPAWWAVIVGLVAPVLGYIRWRFTRERKSISAQITSDISLIGTDAFATKNFNIEYLGHPVQNARIIAVRFTNNGNVPLLEEDYSAPISVYFGQDARIFSLEVIQQYPEDLQVITHDKSGSIFLTLPLLNPGDHFSIKALIDNAENEVRIRGRVAKFTLKMLDQRGRKDLRMLWRQGMGALVLGAFVAGFSVKAWPNFIDISILILSSILVAVFFRGLNLSLFKQYATGDTTSQVSAVRPTKASLLKVVPFGMAIPAFAIVSLYYVLGTHRAVNEVSSLLMPAKEEVASSALAGRILVDKRITIEYVNIAFDASKNKTYIIPSINELYDKWIEGSFIVWSVSKPSDKFPDQTISVNLSTDVPRGFEPGHIMVNFDRSWEKKLSELTEGYQAYNARGATREGSKIKAICQIVPAERYVSLEHCELVEATATE